MEYSVSRLISEMIRYNAGDPRRIHHALKVYAFSKAIGGEERLSPAQRKILEAAAVLHDIGIHESERKYGSSAGRYQELEGPPAARELLKPFDLPTEFTDRVCYLIGHHHTYDGIDGIDYQILVEADFLVNLYEDGCTREAARSALERVFKTETGKGYLKSMFFSE
ncbi:hypothetical protein CAFE_16530 [Caprobacter fermentans]|uniref:HD domain-containing protein n=1 Tax=Caproicibacter fermentans TaxID=2576756 RepID=A0A6N8HYV6_9FIRM|nr:HD domain-containing protein [Caproicibacter fermentans]MVB10952.1 hypothetical protein [Caproicibacter fermentans]OCN01654.1 HD family phosphohydrolase [Clostridium sp. W14A]